MKAGKIAPYLVTLLFLFLGIRYIYANIDKFSEVTIESTYGIIGVVITLLAVFFLNGIIFQKLVEIFRIRMNLLEALALSFVTTMGNYIVPYVGGMGFRGAYLKKKYDFPISWFMSTVAAVGLLSLIISAVMGLLVILVMSSLSGYLHLTEFIIFAGAFSGGVIILIIRYKKINSRHWFANKINNIIAGWGIISRDRKRLTILIYILTIISVVRVLLIYFAFSAFTSGVSIFKIAVVTAMERMSAILDITPARIGVTESIIVISARSLDFSPVLSLSAAVLTRIISVILSFAGGAISSFFLVRSVKPGKEWR